jgi:hypothetical protein
MRTAQSLFRKNRVKIILIGLILGNLALFQLTSTMFSHNKKAEVDREKKEKTSYFQGGVYIIHLGHSVIDYFRHFGERNDK